LSRLVPQLSPASRRASVAIAACFLALALTACGGEDRPAADGEARGATGATGAEGAGEPAPFDQRLRRRIIEQQGLSSDEARCVIDKTSERVDEGDLEEARKGKVPPAVTQAVLGAGARCSLRDEE
jgi:hypothetical protein